MDFITGLPKSGNKSVIMVIVDKISKYAHFYALPHPFTPALVDQSFMDQIFKLHGMPTSIVSDRDPIFTCRFWEAFQDALGTKLNFSTAYHPQSDGQTERVNRILEDLLHGCILDFGGSWEDHCIWSNSLITTAIRPV